MTDANLMDANCIHGVVWYECKECDRQVNADLIADAYRASCELLEGFLVEWVDDGVHPSGMMLSCQRCGVHDWRPETHRPFLALFESALGHRQVCPP